MTMISAHFLGMLINDEEKRKRLRHTIKPNEYADPIMRNIATALKQEEFSLVDLLQKYGKESCVMAMNISNQEAQKALLEKYRKSEVCNG